jgi:hypothetical protein
MCSRRVQYISPDPSEVLLASLILSHTGQEKSSFRTESTWLRLRQRAAVDKRPEMSVFAVGRCHDIGKLGTNMFPDSEPV